MVNLNVNGPLDPAITAAEYEAITGDRIFPSGHPVLQKLNPRVIGMYLQFP